jgi:hypothetical protein
MGPIGTYLCHPVRCDSCLGTFSISCQTSQASSARTSTFTAHRQSAPSARAQSVADISTMDQEIWPYLLSPFRTTRHHRAWYLLDKRGNIYSGRPRLVMGAECLSKGLRLVFMPYTSRYRKHQRLTSGHLTLQLSQTYRPLQDLESRQLVREMLSTDNFSTRFHRYASSFMFSLLYVRL